MDRRSEKTVLALLTIAGGVGLGFLLAPKSGRAARRVLGDWMETLERRLEDQLEHTSRQLSAEAAHLITEIMNELLPRFEEPEEEWEEIFSDLVEELERLPNE